MITDKKITKNYIYNVSYQILVLLVPLATMPYISRVLGPDAIGAVSYAQSVVAYFTLFATMGIFTFGQREISYSRDNRYSSSLVFWETKLLSFSASLAVLIIYLVFTGFQNDRRMYIALLFSVLSVIADVTWFFQGIEEFGKIVLRNMAAKIAGLVFVFLFVKTPDDVYKYAFSLTFFTFLGNISLWLELPKYISFVPLRELHPFRNLPVVLSLFIPTIAIQIYTVLDKTMIGLITRENAENGYYEQAIMISKMALAIVTAIGAVLIPRIGYYYEHNNRNGLRELMYKAYRFVWFLGIPLCFGLIAVSGNFVAWFYGPDFSKVAGLLNVLSFLILAIGISNVTGIQYLIPTKQEKIFTRTVLTGAVVNFCLNIVLIKFYKSTGAAIASIIAETVISVVQLYYVRNEFSGKEILRSGTNYFISGIIMLAVLLPVGKRLSPSIAHTILLVVTGAVIYFSVLAALKDEFIVSAKKLISEKISGRKN